MNDAVPYGAIEAGGTKWVCAVGTGPDDIRAIQRFPTTTPEETLTSCVDFFRRQGALQAIGIGTFGPVDLNHASPTYGYITSTPKPGWKNTDVVGAFKSSLGLPVALDTDVNAALLGEVKWGAAQGLTDAIYVTVGTGIGGGAMVNGHLAHGLLHPEFGHMFIPRDPSDTFAGACSYHGDCLEGLAAGPALEARWKVAGETMAADHPAWALEAGYLAYALVNMTCLLSPQRIIVGGGVGGNPALLSRVRERFQTILNGYLQAPALLDGIDGYLVSPGLEGRSGILGAIALAQLEYGSL
ncbi:MAG: fructokinase [Capsulimonas sp.]|nr:fructokinase [Capsulimonas sp.]